MNDETAPTRQLAPLASLARCGILSDDEGKIFILHEENAPLAVTWIEYDSQDDQFFMISEDGNSQQLGFELDAQTRENLAKAEHITLLCVQNGKILQQQNVSLVFRQY